MDLHSETLTYDDFLINDVVTLVPVEREEVGEDAHYDDGRDPDEDVRRHHGGGRPDVVVSCHGHGVRISKSKSCCRRRALERKNVRKAARLSIKALSMVTGFEMFGREHE